MAGDANLPSRGVVNLPVEDSFVKEGATPAMGYGKDSCRQASSFTNRFLGNRWSVHKKRVGFLFRPDDFRPSELIDSLKVFYYMCIRTGKQDGGGSHSCVEGSQFLPCGTRWGVLGKLWSERFVVSAAGMPLEKWRKIEKFEIPGVRPGSVQWELVWKSPFSNSLSQTHPRAPKHGGIKSRVSQERKPGAVRCVVDGEGIRFARNYESKIRDYFEA